MANVNEKLDQIVEQARRMAEGNATFLEEMRREWERLRGIKIIRLPVNNLRATASALTVIGENMPNLIGPDQGFVWSIKNLVIEGMTVSPVPDVINITRGSGKFTDWQLNGSVFAQTFGKADQILFPGDSWGVASVGTFNSTAPIVIHGHAWQVPAEQIGKIL